MASDRRYDWAAAAAAAAHFLNLGHLDRGELKAMQLQKIASVIGDAIKLFGKLVGAAFKAAISHNAKPK